MSGRCEHAWRCFAQPERDDAGGNREADRQILSVQFNPAEQTLDSVPPGIERFSGILCNHPDAMWP
jgi:hypothetical protein